MTEHEIKVKTITLDEKDIKTAVVFWLKERGIRDIEEKDVECSCDDDNVSAVIKITEELNPDKK